MGGQIRTCDAHKQPFPQNIVDTGKTEMLKVYAERYIKDPKDGKKKIKVSMFVGEQPDEGADFCLADFNQVLGERIIPVGGKISWKKVSWEKQTVERKDGSGTYEKLTKNIEEVE